MRWIARSATLILALAALCVAQTDVREQAGQ